MLSQNYSMTPPLTPGPVEKDVDEALDYMDMLESDDFMEPNQSHDVPGYSFDTFVMFKCQGVVKEASSMHLDSYLKRKVLKNILENKYYLLHQFKETELFGSRFSAQTFRRNMDYYFMKIRQLFTEFEQKAKSSFLSSNYASKSNMQNSREEIVKFFWFLISFIDRFESKNLLPAIGEQLFELLCFMGPLSQWSLPSRVGKPIYQEQNITWEFFHLNLDIRWWILTILFCVDKKGVEVPMPTDLVTITQGDLFFDGRLTGTSALDAAISFLIWDLIGVLKKTFEKDQNSEDLSGFPCTCCHELACTLVAYVDSRGKLPEKKTFWELVRCWFIVLLKRKSNPDYGLTYFDSFNGGKYTSQEILWIFYNISELYEWDVEGDQQPITSKDSVQCEPKLLRTILIMAFGQNGGDMNRIAEVDLRSYMKMFLRTINLWRNDRTLKVWDCVVVVWEYMCKNINNSFFQSGSNLSNFASQSKTSKGLVKAVMEMNCEYKSVSRAETSWQTFLRILVCMLKRSDQEWRSLRGRIYSRFHEKKLAELSPAAIYNIFFMYLVIAWNGDTLNVCSKLVDLLVMVPENDPKKLKMVFMGLVSIATLLVEKNLHLPSVAEKLSSKLCRLGQICNGASDVMLRRDYGEIFVFYCDSTQDILNSLDQVSGEELDMIDSSLATHLNHASIVETNSIFNLLVCALDKIATISAMAHRIADGSCLSVLTKFWEKFKKSLLDQSSSLTPPENLAPVVSKLITISSKIQCISNPSLGTLKNYSQEMLALILTKDGISNRYSCECLSLLLVDPVEVEQIIKVFPKLDDDAICKFLGSYVLLGEIEEVQTACDAILKLPSIQSMVQAMSNDARATITLLFAKLSESHDAAQDFRKRILIREKVQTFVKAMEKPLVGMLKKPFLPAHALDVVKLIGKVISKYPSYLYIKGKPTCSLPSLLSSLILPTSIYDSEKPLTKGLSDIISVLLPKMMLALSTLQAAATSDAYLSRSFRDIIVNYVYRYEIITHPFLSFFNEDCISMDVRKMTIKILNEHFLEKRKCAPAQLQLVLGLLLRLLGCDPAGWNVILCELVFYNLLEILLYIDELTTRRATTDLIDRIFKEASAQSSIENHLLLESIRKFVSSQLCWSPAKVFRILCVLSVMNQSLIVDSLPHIMEQVQQTENKRGTGVDMGLRKGYQDLLSQLGVDKTSIAL